VAQVLLTLPYSFSQLGMVSGVLLQIFYGLMGSWTAYLISVLYVEYRARKEKEGVSFKNHVIQVGRSVRVGYPLSPAQPPPPAPGRAALHSLAPPQPFPVPFPRRPASPGAGGHGSCATTLMLLFVGRGAWELDPLAMVGHARRAIDRCALEFRGAGDE
jgi:hypothetical protein